MSTSVRRVEDKRFITGTGTFIDDLSLPGQAYAAILRSPHAHARIVTIDVSPARSAPGVLLVVTGAEWVAAGHGAIPTKTVVRTKRDGSPFNEPKRYCLAVDAVHHVGEPVALVVAEGQAEAEAALELIEVSYADLPAVAHQVPALAEGAPQLWAEAPPPPAPAPDAPPPADRRSSPRSAPAPPRPQPWSPPPAAPPARRRDARRRRPGSTAWAR